MILCDVNVLVYAFRQDAARHEQFKAWLEKTLMEEPAVGLSSMVLSSVIRITTHPRIFKEPSTLHEAMDYARYLLDLPNTIQVDPGSLHWNIFSDLCKKVEARGNLIPDAYLAALAIESGAEWITTDRDFARFPGLHWRHPLDGGGTVLK